MVPSAWRVGGCTVPMAAVLASTHALCTRGTKAPSTLTCCSGGPGSSRPSPSSCSRAYWVSCTATYAAPARSVSRVSVASLSCVCTKCASIVAAAPKGSQVPRRTALSASVGVRLLCGSSPSSSSRGKNPPATGGTHGGTALQRNRLFVAGGQHSLLVPAQHQPAATVRANRARRPHLLPHVPRRALHRHVRQHPRPYPRQPLIQRRLDLLERRAWVLHPPLPHAGERLCCQLVPRLPALPCLRPSHRPATLRSSPSTPFSAAYAVSLLLATPLAGNLTDTPLFRLKFWSNSSLARE